jgi:spermidine synthase
MRWDPDFAGVLGRLYGWNTLGAVAGALGAEMMLVERFGIRGSALAALLFNSIAAAVAVWLSHQASEGIVGTDTEFLRFRIRCLSPQLKRILMAAFLLGACLLALEVVWFRFLSMFVVTGTLAFALMLSVVLTGVGTGSLVASRWLKSRPDAVRHLPLVAFAAGVSLILTYWPFQVGSQDYERAVTWNSMVFFALRLFFPVALLSGMLFTFQGAAIRKEVIDETRAVGWLTLFNTIGSMLGALVAGFLLIPVFGMELSFFCLWPMRLLPC